MNIGNINLDIQPVVAGVLTELKPSYLKRSNAQIFEIRIDLFEKFDINCIRDTIRLVKETTGKPVIATVRSDEERGAEINMLKLTEQERLDIFKGIIDIVDAVDIEIYSQKINKEVIRLAKERKVTTIVSYHDFKMTPEEPKLEIVLIDAKKLKGDIVKFACMAQKRDDVARLLSFIYTHKKEKSFIAVSMGSTYSITRIIAPLFGSCLIYTPVSESTAPGQMDINLTLDLVKKFYP